MARGNEEQPAVGKRGKLLSRPVVTLRGKAIKKRNPSKSEEEAIDPGVLLSLNGNILFEKKGATKAELLLLLHDKNPNIGLYPGVEAPHADLRDGNWGSFIFSSSNFLGARFDGSRMPGAQFSKGSVLNEASFRAVDAPGIVFSSLSLKDADLCDGNFTRAHIRSSSLRGAKIKGANFTGANFSSSDLTGLDFTDTIIDGANFERAVLNETKIQNSTALANTRLQFTKFIAADLRGSSFAGSHLEHSNFSSAKLRDVSFAGAYLTYTNFSHADLSGVDFRGAKDLDKADLSGTGYDSSRGRKQLLKGKNL